jgi:uncharacterized protein (TIGR03437 family)
MRKRLAAARAVVFLLAASATGLLGNSAGPGPGYSSAPGEGDCSACHDSSAVNSGPGRVEIQFADGQSTYSPGTTKRIRVLITDANARRWGFQLAAREATNTNRQAGSFAPVNSFTAAECTDGVNSILKPDGNCPGNLPRQLIGHTVAGSRAGTVGPVTFEFDWTPPTSNVGGVAFYVSANAANNNGSTNGDRVYTANTQIAFSGPPAGPRPTFPAAGIINAASFSAQTPFSEGSFFSIFGTNLATQTLVWDNFFQNGVGPTTLGNVRVLVNDRPAFLSLVSPGQINAIAPPGTTAGGNNVVVEVNGVRSDPVAVVAGSLSPAVFVFSPRSNRYLAATTGDGSAFIGPEDLFGGPVNGRAFRPARSNEIITLYGTGFGPTNPATEIGRVPSGAAPTASPVTFRVGTTAVTPEYAGRSGFVGVYQFNIRIPQLPDGEYEVTATINGVTTQSGRFLTVKN